MLFAIGTKVRLIHTGDQGRVITLLSNGMVNVHLEEDDMVIPVAAEDLELLTDHSIKIPLPSSPPKAKQQNQAPPLKAPSSFAQSALTHEGILLAFDPILSADATAEKYELYLVNDTIYDILFQFAMSLNGATAEKKNNKLSSASILKVGELWFDELNEAPEIAVESWRITTDGTGGKQERKLRIKAKTFFNSVQIAPLLNKQVHLFKLFDNLSDTRGSQQEDLKSYTKRLTKPAPTTTPIGQLITADNVAFAEFPTEIDLHIEKLVDPTRKLDKSAILRLQLNAFDQYISQAIRFGVERVFVIHGVGEGKLKNVIATRLIQIPEVQSFKNEFHPRYGFGATEVIF